MSASRVAASRQYTGDRRLDVVQDQVHDVRDTLNACPFIHGRLVSVTFTANVGRVVNHGLRAPAACFVVRHNYGSTTPAKLAESSIPVQDVNLQAALVCDVTCTLDLWFYPRASRPIDSATGQSP